MKWPTFSESTPNAEYNFSASPANSRPIRLLIIMGLVFMLAFLFVYFQPVSRGYSWLYGMLTFSVLFKLLRLAHEWYHYWRVDPPRPAAIDRDWTVDVMTTYCLGEPQDMLINTLHAILRIRYPHTTYLCDETNDPSLRQICAELGVRYVTRVDKTDAKAGNINNALYEATGEICLIIDPDHVPVPDFLDHVLPYFAEPSVGFVQCVQAYYNRKQSAVAFGATEQTYGFYGPMMTSMGRYGTAQAIGANCTFRRAALDSIGGHANGLSEDMHTAMRLHANGWTSVYVPLPLSFGLVPATLSAYYKQQLKWARGTFELLVSVYPYVFKGLSGRQRLHYATLPLYYLLGLVQLVDLLIPILSLVMMKLPLKIDLLVFSTVYFPLVLTAFLIRQYAQRWLIERHEAGFHLVGGILASGTWWVYALGFVYTLFRIRVPYLPTPKNDQPRNHIWLILPNLIMCGLTLLSIVYSLYWYGRFALNNVYSQLMIGFGLLNVIILGCTVVMGQEVALARLGTRLKHLLTRRPRFFRSLRLRLWYLRHDFYDRLRQSAITLFGAVLILSLIMGLFVYRKKTVKLPNNLTYATTQNFYVGLEAGARTSAIPATTPVLLSQHLKWSIGADSGISSWTAAANTAVTPVLYLEPVIAQGIAEGEMVNFLNRLIAGRYDGTLQTFTRQIRQFDRPLFICFMPEFDNIGHPWGMNDDRGLQLHSKAWQYIVRFCQQEQVKNITWLWCPSLPSSIVSYYPGSDYVDWLGFQVVDDVDTVADHQSHSFSAHFQLLHSTVRTHPSYSIRQKPILITQLGSAAGGISARRWTNEAVGQLQERYPSVRGVLFRDAADFNHHSYHLLAQTPF
jgi:cellulose synthase (UDP-forming)